MNLDNGLFAAIVIVCGFLACGYTLLDCEDCVSKGGHYVDYRCIDDKAIIR